jgi:hypothetical protein
MTCTVWEIMMMSKKFVLLAAFLLAISMVVYATGMTPASAAVLPAGSASSFTFASIGDAHADPTRFSATVKQISSLNPEFVIFNGDLENDGVVSSEITPMISVLKNANLFNNTFLVRGNHDDHVSGSAALWENYFETAPNIKVLPAGVTNYVSLNSSSNYLTYSFNYGNSIFIGLDVPGDVDLLNINTTLLKFLDSRLTYAEGQGLTHAFIFFHGPLYCVESTHCECSTKADASCTPSALVSVINKHPIVSATFHGHEHILGWTHMDNTRVVGLTGSFEQFITSPSGGWSYNSYLYPARMDYTYMNIGSSTGFATIAVNGGSFTVSIYKVGTTQPVWSNIFYKSGTSSSTPTPTATNTRKPKLTATPTSAPANKVSTFISTGAYDGWTLESAETSNKGGKFNAAAKTFQLGDDALDRQYKAVLSFDTTSLPDNAVIQSVTLQIVQSGSLVGSNPFKIMGALLVDIRRGTFGTPALSGADFQALVSSKKVATFNKTPVSGWYSALLNPAGRSNINKVGVTQFRLYFAKDDNDDLGADFMKFFSGNNTTLRPQLVVTYTMP